MQRNLAFDQTPPLSVPLRFFLSAPLFALAAAVLLLWQGPAALASRWSPSTLALTHLLTLGFLANVMIGALIQILPVIAGIVIPRPQLTASVVHTCLTAGTVLLASAFWWSQPILFRLALLLLILAFGAILVASAIGFWRAPQQAPTGTVLAIRLAIAALAVTIGSGVTLASAFAWPLAVPLMLLTDLHVLWGLLGWVGLLTMGVAYQVVPMFMVTPAYSPGLTRWLAAALFVLLLLWSAAEVAGQGHTHWASVPLSALIAASLVLFATTTLYLLWRRRRPTADATTLFWRTAMGSLLACATIWMLPSGIAPASVTLLLGVLFIVGFGYSVINGMLYKIVPFLVWYHLQNKVQGGCGTVPGIRQIIADKVAIGQFRCHLAALLLLAAATQWAAPLARIAALAMCISSGWLALNLFNAARIYWRMVRGLGTPAPSAVVTA